jgi:hypothetical protein
MQNISDGTINTLSSQTMEEIKKLTMRLEKCEKNISSNLNKINHIDNEMTTIKAEIIEIKEYHTENKQAHEGTKQTLEKLIALMTNNNRNINDQQSKKREAETALANNKTKRMAIIKNNIILNNNKSNSNNSTNSINQYQIKITTLNANGLKNNFQYINLLADETDILCLQETMCKNEQNIIENLFIKIVFTNNSVKEKIKDEVVAVLLLLWTRK